MIAHGQLHPLPRSIAVGKWWGKCRTCKHTHKHLANHLCDLQEIGHLEPLPRKEKKRGGKEKKPKKARLRISALTKLIIKTGRN